MIETWCWDPKVRGRVSLERVEERILAIENRYRPRAVRVDAYQGVLLTDRLRRRGVSIEAVPVTLDVNQRTFEALAELLAERRLVWKRDPVLERELLGLELQETRTGRFSVVDADRKHHRDLALSLALAALLRARRRPEFEVAAVK